MRKRIWMISLLMLLISSTIWADDKLNVYDFRISPGETKEIEVCMENDVSYVAFQFDLHLPQGLTLESYSVGDRVPESTTVSMSEMDDGSYRFIAAAMQAESISGYGGSIVNLTLKASENFSEDESKGYLRNVKLAKADASGVNIPELSFIINKTIVIAEQLTINNFDITIGETKQVNVSLTDNGGYVAFQFDLYLPEGITILSAEADRSRVPENTSLLMSQQEDGSYRFITAAMSGETLVGKSGSIVNLTVKADENISAGKKTGYFRKIKLAKADATGNRYSEMSFGINVKEQPCTVTAKSYTRVYGDANPVFEYTTEGASLNGTPTITCNATETSAVGTYAITISKGSVTNSNVTFVDGKLTITTKTVDKPTILLSETNYTFDGNAKEPTATVKDGDKTIPAAEYSVSYTNNTNAGTATVTITDVEGGNYAVSGSTTFTISAADGSLTAPTGNSNLVYNGVAQNLVTAGSSTTGTVQYSLDGTTYDTGVPQGTDAGSYTVYYKVTGDANHNDIAAQHFDVKIAKAALTVSAGDYEIYEGEEIPLFEVKYEGFVNNETADVLTTKPTISCEATKSSSPDEYKVTVSGAEAKNYEITHVDGKLTILAKSFVSGGDENKDEDDSATYQVNNHGGDGDTPPTVAITDDKDVSGSFAIPESVTYQNKTYTVTEIGEGAFENNKNLTNVSIPSSITNIGDKAFKGCSNLKSITVNITTPISLSAPAATRRMMTRTDGSSVFDGVDMATCILYVPEGSVELYKAAPVWSDFQNILAIGSTGINGIIQNGKPQDIYDLKGRRVKAKTTTLEGLPRGIYIINGKKTTLK